jgi:predicted dehydrogenase
VQPHAENPPGTVSLTVFRQGQAEVCSFRDEPSPLVRQAAAFLDALETRQETRNPPHDALLDVGLAEAISLSARERRTVFLAELQ